MGFFKSKEPTESEKLVTVVVELPARVAEWTPEQRAAFTAQSDAAAFEQASKPGRK